MTALRFTDLAFTKQNFDDASKELYGDFQDEIKYQRVKEIAHYHHPESKYPETVHVSAYQPVPGQQKILIFVEGSALDGTCFYYCLVLILESGDDYKIEAAYRSTDGKAFPDDPLRRALSL
jgi:hypothetical protein